jgi:hypothetical protein
MALLRHRSYVDNRRSPVIGRYRGRQGPGYVVDHLLPFPTRGDVLESRCHWGERASDQDAGQCLAQVKIGAGACDDTHSAAQRLCRACSVCCCPTDRERASCQIMCGVSDDQIVQFNHQDGFALSP